MSTEDEKKSAIGALGRRKLRLERRSLGGKVTLMQNFKLFSY